MSISRAIKRAYSIMRERNWDTVYWAVDLHDTVLRANYETGGYEWISADAHNALRAITSLPETKLIIWSSVHDADKQGVLDFFKHQGIEVFGFNENPDVPNTVTGNFDQKFYFSVLVDDKAGFNYEEWPFVQQFTQQLSREFHDE